jgi:aminoglycoside phosphotransferase (APT) family kinase protein
MNDFSHFVGTRPVTGAHAFDVGRLSTWLENNLPGFAGPLTVEMFKGGQSNPTYKLVTPAQSYVMRAKPGPVAKLLPSAHAIEREFAVMKGLAWHRCARGPHARAVRRRIGHRPRLLRHGIRARSRALGPVPSRHEQ